MNRPTKMNSPINSNILYMRSRGEFIEMHAIKTSARWGSFLSRNKNYFRFLRHLPFYEIVKIDQELSDELMQIISNKTLQVQRQSFKTAQVFREKECDMLIQIFGTTRVEYLRGTQVQ